MILAVAHQQFSKMGLDDVSGLMGNKPVLIDVKGIIHRKKGKDDELLFLKQYPDACIGDKGHAYSA